MAIGKKRESRHRTVLNCSEGMKVNPQARALQHTEAYVVWSRALWVPEGDECAAEPDHGQ
jgi:hypothetical protein